MIIINKQARNIVVAGILLRPGANIVEANDSDQILESQAISEKFKKPGIIDWMNNHPKLELEADDSDSDSTIREISEIDTEDAIDLIKETWDHNALEALKEQEDNHPEPRPAIFKAITVQLDSVKKRMQNSNNNS